MRGAGLFPAGRGRMERAGPGVVEEPAGYVLDGTRGAAMRYTVADWYQKG